MLFKITIFLNFLILILLQDSCNNLLKTNKCFSNYCSVNHDDKECSVNNIFIIENTNGDIYLNQDLDFTILFGTTLSKKEDRIFYGFMYGEVMENYFNAEDTYFSQKINIGRSERIEIKNAELALQYISGSLIFLIGSDNSFIEIYEKKGTIINNLLIEPTTFMKGDIIIKGKPSLFKFINSKLYFVALTSTEGNSNYYNISFYEYSYNSREGFYNSYKLNLEYHFETEVKGEYVSCDSFNDQVLISCFYLTKDNNYTIILVYKQNNEFILKNISVVEKKEDINLDKIYFMKVVLFSLDFCIYAYYSGDSNNIPTFLIKTISDYSLINDRFNDFPVVNLYDYKFNNEIKYNDLVANNDDEVYFISTDKDKENIIIFYLKFYLLNDDKEQLLIRYYIIPLKQNYNMKIFNGLKAIYFNFDNSDYIPFLTLGFNFCFNEECDNFNNSGLIIFSYPSALIDNKLDFIEYAFKYNINYTILDLTEIFGIQNNIFGYSIDYIMLFPNEDNIELIGVDGEDMNTFNPEKPIVKIILNDNIFKLSNFEFSVYILFSLPESVEEFNEHCNKINETFGVKNDESSYTLYQCKESHIFYYSIFINYELSNNCTVDCILCLDNDPNYCIVCKGKYTFIFGDEYKFGKKKICSEVQNDINSTEDFSHNIIISYDIKTDNLTNDSIGIDFKSTYSHTNTKLYFDYSSNPNSVENINKDDLNNKNNTDINKTYIFNRINSAKSSKKYISDRLDSSCYNYSYETNPNIITRNNDNSIINKNYKSSNEEKKYESIKIDDIPPKKKENKINFSNSFCRSNSLTQFRMEIISENTNKKYNKNYSFSSFNFKINNKKSNFQNNINKYFNELNENSEEINNVNSDGNDNIVSKILKENNNRTSTKDVSTQYQEYYYNNENFNDIKNKLFFRNKKYSRGNNTEKPEIRRSFSNYSKISIPKKISHENNSSNENNNSVLFAPKNNTLFEYSQFKSNYEKLKSCKKLNSTNFCTDNLFRVNTLKKKGNYPYNNGDEFYRKKTYVNMLDNKRNTYDKIPHHLKTDKNDGGLWSDFSMSGNKARGLTEQSSSIYSINGSYLSNKNKFNRGSNNRNNEFKVINNKINNTKIYNDKVKLINIIRDLEQKVIERDEIIEFQNKQIEQIKNRINFIQNLQNNNNANNEQ